MRLFRTKVWSWADIWILKWCAFLFGMIGGAYLSGFVKQYVWVLLVLAIGLGIRSGYRYFGNID
jgi:hypothetical protein